MGFFSITWFRTKTLNVIKLQLDYNVKTPGSDLKAFNWATRMAQESGWNEYDAAIAFMTIKLDEISEPHLSPYFESMCLSLKTLTYRSKAGDKILRTFLEKKFDIDEPAKGSAIVEETATPTDSSDNIESRLTALKKLQVSGLITQEQYGKRSAEILKAL